VAVPELKQGKTEGFGPKHGCTIADPAELRWFKHPVGSGIFKNHYHCQISALVHCRVGPPALGLDVDFSVLSDV